MTAMDLGIGHGHGIRVGDGKSAGTGSQDGGRNNGGELHVGIE